MESSQFFWFMELNYPKKTKNLGNLLFILGGHGVSRVYFFNRKIVEFGVNFIGF